MKEKDFVPITFHLWPGDNNAWNNGCYAMTMVILSITLIIYIQVIFYLSACVTWYMYQAVQQLTYCLCSNITYAKKIYDFNFRVLSGKGR